MKALIFDNKVVQVEVSEFEVSEALTWMDNAPDGCKAGWLLKDGVLVAPPEPPERTYDEKRKSEYLRLDQFEMQYDDEVNGTTTWKDAIAAIKTKYPKP
jgi:hypothetical protein